MMYIQAEQLPREATARLKAAGYGRQAKEEVAHEEVNGDLITLTFIRASFFGAVGRHTMSREQFERDFALIKGAGR